MITNEREDNPNILNEVVLIRIGIGSKNMISISKIKNSTANKKKRMEKGIRAFEEGSKPHSKVDVFSRSFKV